MKTINWRARAKEAKLEVRNFIDGQYSHCLGEKLISKYSPRDGSLMYQFGQGNGGEVEQAVSSARQAYEEGHWRFLSVYERKDILHTLADLIEAHKEEFALYECLDVGKPISHALNDDVPSAAAVIRSSAEGMDKVLSPSGSDGGVFAYQQRKPVGVVGGIVGWNYPLALAAQKVGPAVAMGNSLVLKPSEFTSLSTCRLAELAIEAGVPNGVFNVVNGAGKVVGDALARHGAVDLLTFVGSSATGKHMMLAAGQSNMKRLILECGGKSPYLVFDDCPEDLDVLAADIVGMAFPNQGALCVAGTRLLLQENIKAKLLAKILELTKQLSPQDPLDEDARFGALIHEAHMRKVLSYISCGKEQGADLIIGGKRVNQDSGGYYVEPTIFDHVDPNSTIAQEEIFGPVLSIHTFKTEEEAIRIANNSRYGLAAYASTQKLGRAQRLGEQLNAGYLGILGTSSPTDGGVPIAMEGHKQSGFGLEGGIGGLEAYTVTTTVNIFS